MTDFNIIDRRGQDGENRENRDKFLDRHSKQVKKSVKDVIKDMDVKGLGKDSIDISIDADTDEYSFTTQRGSGNKNIVVPGNDGFVRGDTIPRNPPGGQGQPQASDGDDDTEDFVFRISSDEFMDLFFEDLELPNREHKKLAQSVEATFKRDGYSIHGTPQSLNLGETFKKSYGRRFAFEAYLKSLLEQAKKDGDLKRVKELEKQLKTVPFLDELDVKYNNFSKVPNPCFKAVMFCLMDVSGSMDEAKKDLAKRFFILLHLFLTQNYNQIDIVFVRHTTHAEEVDEQTFFYDPIMGGTCIGTGVKLINEIIDSRYDLNEWNVYVAQASDGDNFEYDNDTLLTQLNVLMQKVQNYCYIETWPLDNVSPYFIDQIPKPNNTNRSDVWKLMRDVCQDNKHLKMALVNSAKDIWPVFRTIFKKED